MGAPDFVADPVQQRLAQVAMERAVVARLELADAPEHLDKGVLHQVVGVDGASCPDG